MPELFVNEAYNYYKTFIYQEERFRLLRQHNLPVTGSVPSRDWELFGAVLTGRQKTSTYGADLQDYEVKSAVQGNSFEYQYHFKGGLSKLDEDMKVDHIFISYSSDYKDVTVRLVKGEHLAPLFTGWRPELVKNYAGPNRKLRFRRSIPYSTVVRHGEIILQIVQGELQSPTAPSL